MSRVDEPSNQGRSTQTKAFRDWLAVMNKGVRNASPPPPPEQTEPGQSLCVCACSGDGVCVIGV